MNKTKHFFLVFLFILSIGLTSCAQSKSESKRETVSQNMLSPEIIVKGFIEDYFLWNEKFYANAYQMQIAEKSALLAIGITEPMRPDQNKNISQYVEIKGKFSDEFVKQLAEATAEYKKIIEKYCRPNYQHLKIAFGSESAHDPKNEVIVSVETKNNKSVVKTKRTKESIGKTKYKYTDDFEFHLTFENNRWYLEQIYYVDEEGKYEGL